TGREMTFASVSELAWQDKGSLLAFATTVEGGVGNGLQLYDAASGTLRALDSSSSVYTQITWRKDSASLAVLRSVVSAKDDRVGPSQLLLVWPDAASPPATRRTLDAASNHQLPAALRV